MSCSVPPPPPGLCLCVLSVLLCCQNKRLVFQSGWRGTRSADKGPCRRSSCSTLLRMKHEIASLLIDTGHLHLPHYFFPFLAIFFFLHSPSNSAYLWFPPQTIRMTYLFSPSLQLLLTLLSSSYLELMPCRILLLSSMRGWISKWMFSLSLYLLPIQSIISVSYSHIQKTQEWNCWACSHV